MPSYSSKPSNGPSEASNAFSSGFDVYGAIGLKRTASQADIKKNYYALARRFHPDKNLPCEYNLERFKDVSRAYEILSDPDTRAEYDDFCTYFSYIGPDEPAEVSMKSIPILVKESIYRLFSGAKSSSTAKWISDIHLLPAGAVIIGRTPSSEKKGIIYATLEDIDSGAIVQVHSAGVVHTVELRRGAISGEIIDVGGKMFSLKVEPHKVFRRGGSTLDPKTTRADLLTTVFLPPGRNRLEGETGDVLAPSRRRYIWNSVDSVPIYPTPPGFTMAWKITLQGKGLPRAGAKGEQRGSIIIALVSSTPLHLKPPLGKEI